MADEFADRAIALLMRGYRAAEMRSPTAIAFLKRSKDFEVLRNRPDFRQLLDQLETQKKN